MKVVGVSARTCVFGVAAVLRATGGGGVVPYDVCMLTASPIYPTYRYTSIKKRQVVVASSPIPPPTGGRRALTCGSLILFFTLHTIVMKNYHGKIHGNQSA